MTKRIVYFIFISLFFTGFLTFTEAQKRFNRHHMHFPPPLMEKLNLSDYQKDKIEELKFNHQKGMIELRSELQLKMLEMKKYRAGEDINRSKIISLTKELNEIRNKISLARANHQMDIFEVLDATQKKIWSDNPPFSCWDNDRKIFRSWRNKGKGWFDREFH